MDAVEYLNQVKRICNGFELCSACPLYYESGPTRCMADVATLISNGFDDVSMLAEKVEKWVKEHPKKTRQSELMKLIPNAKTINGIINVYPCSIDPLYDESPMGECNGRDCDQCRKEYWMEEVE